jgi:hypothetical protein
MDKPRWQQIYEEWKARNDEPRPLVNNSITQEMRQRAVEPEQVSLTPEQKLATLRPRRPRSAAGELCADVCQWCLNPFNFTMKRSGKPRDSIEYEPLRRALKITDAAFDPVICDSCYGQVMKSAPDDRLMPGTSNFVDAGHNLLIRTI